MAILSILAWPFTKALSGLSGLPLMYKVAVFLGLCALSTVIVFLVKRGTQETILSADELGEYIEDTARGVKGFFVPEKYEKKQIDIDSSTDAFKDKAKAKEMLKKGDKLPLVFQSKRDKYVADVQKGLKADAASVVTQASVRHTAPEAKAGCMGCGAGAPTETETYTVTVSGKDAQGFKIIYKVSIGASNGKVPGKAN